MAVYTKLDQNKIEEILLNYNLGKLDSFKGIEEGIENTNYFLSINKKKFILTIYEKRVKSKDLPFFSSRRRHTRCREVSWGSEMCIRDSG